jgi:hypothetical protein
MTEWNCSKPRGGQGAKSEDDGRVDRKRDASSERRNGIA